MSKILTINNRLAMRDSKPNNCCRKCLRKHHTNVCQQPDGSRCDKCTRRHYRTFHNEQFVPANSSLNPQAAPYTNYMQGACTSNYSIQGTSNVPGRNTSKYPQHSISDESPWTKFSSEGEDQRQGRKLGSKPSRC